MRFLPVDTLVRTICAANGDTVGSDYARTLRLLQVSMRELNLFIPVIRSELFTIGTDYTVQLPDYVVDILKVGALTESTNEIRHLGRNERLRVGQQNIAAAEEACTCGGSSASTSTTSTDIVDGGWCAFCGFNNVWLGGRYFGEFYGRRPNNFPNGTWRFDRDLNKIELGSGTDVTVGGKLLVEFRSSLTEPEYAQFPYECEQPLMWRTLQLLNQAQPGVAMGQFQQFKITFTQMQERYKRYTADDWVAAYRGQRHSAPV